MPDRPRIPMKIMLAGELLGSRVVDTREKIVGHIGLHEAWILLLTMGTPFPAMQRLSNGGPDYAAWSGKWAMRERMSSRGEKEKMSMFRRILLPLDGSTRAEHAIPLAACVEILRVRMIAIW